MAHYCFEKYLSETDASTRLSVPIKWLGILPPFEGGREVQFETTDGVGFYWEFCCSIRKKGLYRKPVLQAEGWLRFVNHKGLKVGDKLIFYSELNHFRGTQFRIRAQKLNAEGHWIDV